MKISSKYLKWSQAKISWLLAFGIGGVLLFFILSYAGTCPGKPAAGTNKIRLAPENRDELYYQPTIFLFWTFSRLWYINRDQ